MERIPVLAAELAALKPDVILTAASLVAAKIKQVVPADLPIVMATSADPVEWGLARSLSAPGAL